MGNTDTIKANKDEVDMLDTVTNIEDIIRVITPLLDQYREMPKTPDNSIP